jgi:hypothetical protein
VFPYCRTLPYWTATVLTRSCYCAAVLPNAAVLLLTTVTPPGHKTVGGATVQCGDNEFRADWKPAAEADQCNSCGTGVKMSKTDTLKVFNQLDSNNFTHIPIATSADDCCEWHSAHA